MSKLNGDQPIQRLAKALRPNKEQTTSGRRRCMSVLTALLDRWAQRAKEAIREEFGPRFDKQDETLRMVWRRCGGREDERLPIDD